MEYFYSIILGLVQGFTEFLPVSSSGHLVLLHNFLNFELADNLGFDVALHLATLFALLIFFNKEIVRLIKAFFQSFSKWDLKNNLDQRLSWFILIGIIPATLAGYFLEGQIETVFRSSYLVAITLIFVGLILLLAEKFSQKIADLKDLKFSSALIIGIFQAFALVPGVSRSGITIIAGLSQKLKREAAARFSFLLSIPVIFGAGLKKMIDLDFSSFTTNEITIFILGFLVALVSGYLAIKYLLRFLVNHKLNVFGYYRIVLGVVVLIILFLF